MPLVLNVHTPTHSFALPHKEQDLQTTLTRILGKAGLNESQKKEFLTTDDSNVGLRYEFEGGRWSLQDDDDLKIMYDRFPPTTTSSITLHLTPPPSSSTNTTTNAPSNSLYVSDETPINPPTRSHKSIKSNKSMTTKSSGRVNGTTGGITLGTDTDGDVYESLGDKHKRAWNDFHSENGVRTVIGSIAGVKNVRMLMRLGYRHVYVSRMFALKNNLIPPTSSMGSAGYAGLVNIGVLPITVGNKTMKHTVYLSEEVHFDVVLGRAWMEKVGVKTDPYDQTEVTYMDSGEKIDIDIVVLRDTNGEIITIT